MAVGRGTGGPVGGAMIRAMRRAWSRLTGRPVLAPAERRRLEDWLRLRFQLGPADPMLAVIGGAARLLEAGMDADDAVATTLRILREIADAAGESRSAGDAPGVTALGRAD